DLPRGVDHLRMMNVSQYIVRSQAVKAAAAKEPGLEREAVIGPYEVYRVRANDGRYAIPLAHTPVLVFAKAWKSSAYPWFTHAGPDGVVPVYARPEDVPEEERSRFAGVVDDLPAQVPAREVGPLPTLRETMEPERLVIEGTTPGQPVLVRISYHPRWKATTG